MILLSYVSEVTRKKSRQRQNTCIFCRVDQAMYLPLVLFRIHSSKRHILHCSKNEVRMIRRQEACHRLPVAQQNNKEKKMFYGSLFWLGYF
jgi:hypothetical protein